MNKLVKKSIAGILAGVMAATSLVGSISAFAAVADTEFAKTTAITAGQAYTFERVDGFKKDALGNETTTPNDQTVYSFTPASSGTYVISFVNEANDKAIEDKVTNKYKATTVATLDGYKVVDNKVGAQFVSLPSFTQNLDINEWYVLGTTKTPTKSLYVKYDGSAEVELESGKEYLFKVEQNKFGYYTEKNAKGEDENHYLKSTLTITKSEFKVTPNPVKTVKYPSTPEEEKEVTKDSRGGYTYSETVDRTCAVQYIGNASEIVIPDAINGYKVKTVKALETDVTKDTFVPKSRITSVKMGANVKEIENGAFAGCNLMTTLALNEGLETIGSLAFYNCGMLTGALTIPASVKEIGSQAFYNCGYSSAEIKGKDTVVKEMAIGYEDVLNTATANPTDTYPAPKTGFFMTAPTGSKAAEYAAKFAVKDIDPANCTHEYGDAVEVKATYFAKGSKTYTCKVCGAVKTEDIAKKKVVLASVKSSKKGAITVKTKALSEKVTGYKIQYSTNKNFKNAKTVTVKTNSKKALSKTITGLKAGKKYYVRVRVYKGDQRSAFTAKKAVKVKK